MALMALPFSPRAARLWGARTRGQVVAQEAFGRLERMGEGLFAFISTPLGGDYTTVCNGGIIAGSAGTLVVEGFQTPEGSRWIAEKARELTGRWPTHVVVTHYHGDHTGGVTGLLPAPSVAGAESPRVPNPDFRSTAISRDLVVERYADRIDDAARRLWADVTIVDARGPSSLDLGGRVVRLIPRRGHTDSDVTVELEEEGVVWCGDLVWNGMFPNYMDATPSQLSESVLSLEAGEWDTYVPGHGPLADLQDMGRYVAVIDSVEEAAHQALREGWSAEEAGERFRIPVDLGEWTLFSPSYFERAIGAWLQEVG
jgi:glyoxylase-like metal-dependent hydrolase (beta-lactamase superfamily II)